jgi:hypothetical protein
VENRACFSFTYRSPHPWVCERTAKVRVGGLEFGIGGLEFLKGAVKNTGKMLCTQIPRLRAGGATAYPITKRRKHAFFFHRDSIGLLRGNCSITVV